MKLTAHQAAERLGVAYSTIRKWCNEGRFPGAEAVGIGPQRQTWLIPEEELEGVTKHPSGYPRGRKRG